MFKYTGVAAVLAATYNIQGAIELTALLLIALASVFYIMTFRLFCGLSQAALVDGANILHVVTIYMIYVTMAAVTYMGPYSYIALVALPWLLIQGCINILTILIKLEIVGVQRK